jgi:broad specificity phosphatase PhoE
VGRQLKDVYILRHGKTLDNVKGILMGSNDPPLIPEAEAEIVAMRSFVIQPDLVFSRDLRRARDTARLLFPHHEVTALPFFREWNRGAFQGKPTRLWRDAIAARVRRPNWSARTPPLQKWTPNPFPPCGPAPNRSWS